jgi:hypothetical protein
MSVKINITPLFNVGSRLALPCHHSTGHFFQTEKSPTKVGLSLG